MPRKRVISTMAELSASTMAAFNAINEHFYNGELEKPVITFKEGAKKSAYGWIETRKHWVQGKTERYEINISIDFLGSRPTEATISTLMHEMAHLYNLMHDIKDTSRAGTYHNKKFKETAEAHGLSIDYHEKIGWSLTSLTDEAREWISENINIKGFNIYKKPEQAEEKARKPKQSMRKYVCPLCGTIIRATKEVNVLCADCSNDDVVTYFELAE